MCAGQSRNRPSRPDSHESSRWAGEGYLLCDCVRSTAQSDSKSECVSKCFILLKLPTTQAPSCTRISMPVLPQREELRRSEPVSHVEDGRSVAMANIPVKHVNGIEKQLPVITRNLARDKYLQGGKREAQLRPCIYFCSDCCIGPSRRSHRHFRNTEAFFRSSFLMFTQISSRTCHERGSLNSVQRRALVIHFRHGHPVWTKSHPQPTPMLAAWNNCSPCLENTAMPSIENRPQSEASQTM